MYDDPKQKILRTIEDFITAESQIQEQCEKAIELANEAGFSEVAIGLMQIRIDAKNYRDALELMILGVKFE